MKKGLLQDIETSYPEVFITGKLPTDYPPEAYEALLTADALSAWGLCIAGVEMPEKFGEGMMMIGTVLGITMTPENVMAHSKKFKS